MGKKGMLLFKGDKRPKKKSKKSKAERKSREEITTAETTEVVPMSRKEVATAAASSSSSSSSSQPTIQTGSGRITTSGTVVTGHATKFETELGVGDALLVTLALGKEEMRVVTMRLSNASLNLSSAFSENLREPHAYRYVRKPRNLAEERRKKQQLAAEEAGAVERNAFDIYGTGGAGAGGGQFTYREKTETGSYRVKQQEIGSSNMNSRGALLALRSKKTSDKYC